MATHYRAWGACLQCDFEGTLEFSTLEGEFYEVSEDEMVMLQQRCPACETIDNALLPYRYYLEICAESERDGGE